jgi:glycosyltransferase involved in cell wall biosynthesis
MNPKGPNDIRGELFEVHVGKTVVRCAYDYSDYPLVSEDILAQVDIYFKKSVSPQVNLPKVVSLGFYAKNPRLLARARSIYLKRRPDKRFGVYGRFGSWTDSQPYRRTLVNRLRNSAVDFTGGFGTVIYPAYLRELMQSKIAVDVPGQAPASPRLVEAMALGALVVCAKPACVFPEQIIDGVHYVSFKEDISNVVEICHALLADDERRQRIAQDAMLFFDRNFSPESMARRVIARAVEVAHEK